MLSARKGASRARRHHRYRCLPQAIFVLIGLCVLGCVWFLDLQTSDLSLETNDLLSIRSGREEVAKNNAKALEQDQARNQESGESRDDKAAGNGNAIATVQCGGHTAPSCEACPQGNGKMWCHGDCAWCDGKQECMSKDELCPVKAAANNTSVICGAHSAPSCEACPQGHGEVSRCAAFHLICEVNEVLTKKL